MEIEPTTLLSTILNKEEPTFSTGFNQILEINSLRFLTVTVTANGISDHYITSEFD